MATSVEDAAARSLKLREKGNEEYRQGKYQEAINTYTAAAELHKDKVTLGNRSQAHFKLNTVVSLQHCIDDSNAALELDPKFSKGYFRAANALLKLGRFEEAKGVCDRLLKAFPGESDEEKGYRKQSETYIDHIKECVEKAGKGAECFEKKEWKACAELLKPVVDSATHNLPLLLKFSEAAFEAERYDDVITALRNVISHNPFKLEKALRWYYACSFYQAALLEEAETEFEALHRMDALYQSLDKHRKVLASVTSAINTATTYSKGQKFEWAYNTLTKVMEDKNVNPNMQRLLRTHRAIVLMHQLKYADAIKDCSEALEGSTRGPWRMRAYQCRGYCYEATDEITKAIRDYEAAININPNNPQTKARIEVLKRIRPKRKDYYTILGLDKGAKDAEIKKAYRALALQYHPDKMASGDVAPEERERNKDIFQDIQEAYSILSDPTKRQRYDRGETREAIDGPENDPLVFFNIVCGNLPDDATTCQTCLYETKKCAFWSCACILLTVTCPCWCPCCCLRDRNQYKTQFEKYQQEYQEKYNSAQPE
eukprot:Sspe_Gene.52899::Locus_29285_Transcript_1_1_Confidence_1.000_Length_1913::g.52899::m.52899/K09527/DNAJC7; DnaJ homolog subfamily C member 7